MLGEHAPNRSHIPPDAVQLLTEVSEQLPLTQHEPLHGFGEQVVPPTKVPPPLAHAASVLIVQVVPLQQVPGAETHGLGEQLEPNPNHSPSTLSQALRVRSEQVVPTQHAPTCAAASCPINRAVPHAANKSGRRIQVRTPTRSIVVLMTP